MSTSIQPHAQESNSSSATSGPGPTGQGTVLTALGALGLLAGIGLVAAPSISWTAGQMLGNLGAHWTLGAAVSLGGLGVLSLGLVRRSLAHAARNSSPDPTLLLEQIATDLISLREQLASLGDLGRDQSGSIQNLQAEIGELRQSQSANAVSNEALFQLAASLDKLGHRIDQRLRLHHSTLQDTIDELAATVDHSRRAIEERLGQGSQHAAPVEDGWDLDASNHADWTPPQELEHGPTTAGPAWQAPSEQLDATLDEFVSDPTPQAPGSLGLLDMFDDSVPAPLPRPGESRIDRSLDVDAFELHGSSSDEGEITDKLGQLQSLLADPRLAAALKKLQQQR